MYRSLAPLILIVLFLSSSLLSYSLDNQKDINTIRSHVNEGNYPAAFTHVDKLIASTKNDTTLGLLYNIKGLIFYEKNSLDTALIWMTKSRAIRERFSDTRTLAHTLTNIGSIHERQGRYDSATVTYRQASEIYKFHNKMADLIRIKMNLANIKYNYYDYDAALEDYHNCLKYRQILEKELQFKLYRNIASCHQENHDYEKALRYYDTALASPGAHAQFSHKILVKKDILDILTVLNPDTNYVAAYRKLVDSCLMHNDQLSAALVNLSLGQHLIFHGKYNEAILRLIPLLNYLSEQENLEYAQDCYSLVILAMEFSDTHKDALKYQTDLNDLAKKYHQVNTLNIVSFIHKANQNLYVPKQVMTDKPSDNTSTYIIITLSLITIILLFIIYRLKSNK